MEILKSNNDLKIVINTEQDFRTDLGWQENLMQFEEEVLSDIINPAINYETVRYIHKPYNTTISGVTINQTDIWFKFYFISGGTYVLDYNPIGITTVENELMTKQSTQSFFRLELYKTPGVVNPDRTLTCEPPTRQNRILVNSKNLSLPLGEKFFYTGNGFGYYIHVPIFTGSNYRNKENMYLFWFDDESALTETSLSGTTTLDQYVFGTGTTIQTILFKNEINEITQINIPTTGITLVGWTGQTFTIPNQVTYNRNYYHGMNTFFMTAKFFDAKNGDVIDFTNTAFTTGHTITEQNDMYYQIDFDNFERTYQIYSYNGTKGNRIGSHTGTTLNPINFYEKGGGIVIGATPTPTPTSTPTVTPTPTSTPTVTPTPTATLAPIYYSIFDCYDGAHYYSEQKPFGSIPIYGSPPYARVYGFAPSRPSVGTSFTVQGSTNTPQSTAIPIQYIVGETGCFIAPTPTPTPRTAKFKALYRYSGYTSYTQIQTNMCGKDPSGLYPNVTQYKGNIYTDPSVTGTTLTPGVLYTLYEDNIDGTPIWTSSGSYWWGATVLDVNSKVDYIVRIENGVITEWRDCSTGNIIYP